MPFRANEAAASGFEQAKNYLIPRTLPLKERERSEEVLLGLMEHLGPAVSTYPSWHPLVSNHDARSPVNRPGTVCGYEGLDHSIYFAHGFITCPYGDGINVMTSVNQLPHNHGAAVYAEEIDTIFYNENTTPIFIQCEWLHDLENDNTIPKSLAIPLMLEKELPCWRWATRAETWEAMQPYILGTPHGSRSSLFVNQDTGQHLKKMYMSMNDSGMFGPHK